MKTETIMSPHDLEKVEILSDSENKLRLEILEAFSKKIKRYGFNVGVYSESSLRKLSDLSVEKKGNSSFLSELGTMD